MIQEILEKIRELFIIEDDEMNEDIFISDEIFWYFPLFNINIQKKEIQISFNTDLQPVIVADVIKKLVSNDIIPEVYESFFFDEDHCQIYYQSDLDKKIQDSLFLISKN